MQPNKVLLISILLLLTILINGCIGQKEQASEKGILNGTILIGPICPVERNPPDPNCKPTLETYKSWPIWVWTSDKSLQITPIQPDSNGNYFLELPTGRYVVDLDLRPGSIGNRNLPAYVVINTNKTTTFNIDIDTGIR
ncbi:hypothetical protein HY990_06230 [Candidatus Micrarchaeota archaeon]|nr:hypothetical protein [Candidatus Micrarchaeota archaeon]